MAHDRPGGRRRARVRGADRLRRREGRESLHLVARQRPGAVRPRRPRGTSRSQGAEGPQCGGSSREVRRGTGLDSRLPRPRGRRGGRLSRHSGDRSGHRGTAPEPPRRHRGLPACRTGGEPRSGAALQEPGNAQDGRAPVPRRGRATVARPHRRIRRARRTPGRCPSTRALPQGRRRATLPSRANAPMTAPSVVTKWSSWAPRLLSVLRILPAFIFIQAGTMKLFAFPIGMPPNGATATPWSEFWIAGVIEVVGGAFVLLGLFTRPVGFLLSGDCAVAS